MKHKTNSWLQFVSYYVQLYNLESFLLLSARVALILFFYLDIESSTILCDQITVTSAPCGCMLGGSEEFSAMKNKVWQMAEKLKARCDQYWRLSRHVSYQDRVLVDRVHQTLYQLDEQVKAARALLRESEMRYSKLAADYQQLMARHQVVVGEND